MDFSTNSRFWISVPVKSASRYVLVPLVVILLAFCFSCGYGEEDRSKEGRQAIHKVQGYRTPLSGTVSNGVMNYIYKYEFEGEKVVRDDWYAIKSFYADGINIRTKYHVMYRFTLHQKHKEVSFEYFPSTGKVVAGNRLARELTGLQ